MIKKTKIVIIRKKQKKNRFSGAKNIIKNVTKVFTKKIINKKNFSQVFMKKKN